MELDLYKHDFPILLDPRGQPTFSLEDNLPSLPVPLLSETLDLYLTSVRPFVTDAEFVTTTAAVRDFESGIGQELQAKLLERGRKERNWLADWWLHFAYLTNRTALHPLLNMSGVGPYHRQYWPARKGSALERASAMCRYYAELWKSLRDETFRVDKKGSGKPLSMDQFRFGLSGIA